MTILAADFHEGGLRHLQFSLSHLLLTLSHVFVVTFARKGRHVLVGLVVLSLSSSVTGFTEEVV